jgi:catechol 2,3-dioxygenase-like lactoylglutathione lyase family enzyme
VRATRINHVSIHAVDIEESIRFYTELFGMRRLPTPNFPDGHVVWLQLGEQQLHLFDRTVDAPANHHFALDVDDFAAVYRRAKERGLLDPDAFRAQIRRHPMGWVQMYLRDPAGNLIEIDWPDVATLPPELAAEIPKLEDAVPQTGEAAVATLYLAGGP